MKSKKILSFLCVVISVIFAFETIFFDGKIVNAATSQSESTDKFVISTVEDFETFAKNCSLDEWSKGKTIVLNNNLDLKKAQNIMVPYFGGVFEGNGYVIKNLVIKSKNSYCGMFSKTTEDAIIRNLKVEATIKPTGEPFDVGGIVGKNYGTVSKCEFRGVVEGYNYVGQIVGFNAKSGNIANCQSSGKIIGKYYSWRKRI